MKIYQSPSIEFAGGSENVAENSLIAVLYGVAVAVVAVVGGLYGYLVNWCDPYLS